MAFRWESGGGGADGGESKEDNREFGEHVERSSCLEKETRLEEETDIRDLGRQARLYIPQEIYGLVSWN